MSSSPNYPAEHFRAPGIHIGMPESEYFDGEDFGGSTIKSILPDPEDWWWDKPFSTIQGVLKPKDLCMVPNRIAIALQESGWWVRSEIVWAKPNPMPSSAKDRPATSHEKIFLLTKSPKYFYDADAARRASKPFRLIPRAFDGCLGGAACDFSMTAWLKDGADHE